VKEAKLCWKREPAQDIATRSAKPDERWVDVAAAEH